MSASATMSRLSDRAKEAADTVEAAASKGKAELVLQVDEARAKVQKSAAHMKEDRGEAASSVKGHWTELHDSWDGHVAAAREDHAEKKADHDAEHADHRADRAEIDAAWAAEFAEAAIADAEWALLNSRLARMEADDAAALAT